jgi:hypothetical protein
MPNVQQSERNRPDRTPVLPEDLDDRDRTTPRAICKRFYLTPEENQRLDERRQGVPLSTFVRTKVLGVSSPRPRSIVPQLDRQTYVQLTAIKHHCQTIAIALKANPNPLRSQENLDQLDRLEALLTEIAQTLTQTREDEPG